MGVLGRLFSGTHPLDPKVKQISDELGRKCREYLRKHQIDPQEEAIKIGTACGISNKPHHPANFVDITFMLMSYPPEVAYGIASFFDYFTPQLGFIPVGTIMIALSTIESSYSGGMLARVSFLQDNPELMEVINSKPERIRRAGKIIAAGILFAKETLREAREIYKNNVFDPSVRAVVIEELRKFDPEVANAITK